MTVAWRTIALICIALALALTLADAVHGPGGTFGISARTTDVADRRIVTAVTPDVAARTGLRPGDTIRLEPGGLHERFALGAATVGSTLRVVLERPGRVRTVVLVATPGPPVPLIANLFVVFQIASLAVALLVVLRCAHRYEGRLLAGILVSFAFSVSNGAWLPMPIALCVSLCRPIATGFAFASTAAFPTAFPTAVRRSLRAVLGRAVWCCFAVVAALSGWVSWRHVLVGVSVPAWPSTVGNVVTLFDLLVIVVALISSLRDSRGEDRVRVHWISLSLAVGLSGPLVLIASSLSGVGQGTAIAWTWYLASTMIFIPFGVAYAILRHRVLDIGFAVNRALVFAAVSSFIVLSLGAVEWGLGSYLVSTNHVTNSSIALAMALALGFFLRRIHRRIDALIDELLFRDRHKVERNLRRAALEVAFITESEALMTFTHDVVVRNLALKACALYLRRTDGSFEALRMSGTVASVLDCNEPAIVRIRMTRLPVRIEDTTSSLAGVLLLPMLVRDGLIGTVLLGAKLDGEDFAPDEREALRDLVEAMGRSLDALESARLRAEVQQLLRDDALPATGRKRLERSVGSSIKRRVEPGVVEAGPGGEKAPADHGPGRVIRVGSGGDQEVRA